MVQRTLGILATLFIAVATSTHSQSIRECRSAGDFIAALGNISVTSIQILQDFSMTDSDWAAPVVLNRSINVSGTGDSVFDWPVVDLGFVSAKVVLTKNVTLSVTHVVMRNWRKGPLFQAPGIDLIATNEETANQPWDPLYPNLRCHDMIWIQRGCMPFELGTVVTDTTARPPFVPGNQSLTDTLPQTGCVNSSTAPLVQRCWARAFEFTDVVIYGHNFDGFDPRNAGYVLWLKNTPVRCETVLSEECVRAHEALGCFYRVYPPSWLSADSGGSSVTGTGSGTQHDQHHHVYLAAVLGGVLGGLALLAAVGGAMATATVLWRRRQQRAADHHIATAAGEAGGGLPDCAMCTVALWTHAAVNLSDADACPVSGRGPCRARKDVGGPLDESSKGHTIRAVSGALDDKSELGTSDARGLRAAQQLSFLNALKDTASATPVTPLTPLQPDVNLQLSLGTGEVVLLPGVIGKGTFGRVVPGRYAGQQVAVKLLDYGLLMGPDGGGGGERKAAEVGAPPQHSIIQCLSMEPPTTAAPVATGSAAAATGSAAAAAVKNASNALLSSFAMRSFAERQFPDQFLRMLVPGRGVGSGITGVAAAATGESAGAPEAAPAATALHPSRGELQRAEALGSLRGVLKRGLEAAKPTGLKEFIASNFGDGRVGGSGGVKPDGGCDGGGGAFIQGSGKGLGRAGCAQSSGCPGADGDEGRQGAGGAATAAAAAALPAATKPMEAAVNAGALVGDSRQRTFMQEVEVLARIRHPNIVRLLAACTEPPHMCLVMELMETSLDRLLYGSGPGTPLMPLAKVLHIGLQIASALEFLHPTIMHRDLKPGNVLLQNAASPTPIVKLADFGLSRLQTSVLVTEHVEVGTVAYMAPETLSAVNCVVTHHVDIYALGVILWELLAGVRPWAGLGLVQIAFSVSALNQRPPLELLSAERCPPKLHALIQHCWDHVPERRPAAAEVVKELLLVQMQMLVAVRGGGGSSQATTAAAADALLHASDLPPNTAAAAAGVGASVTSARCLGRLNAMVDRPGLHPAVGYREASPADLGGP